MPPKRRPQAKTKRTGVRWWKRKTAKWQTHCERDSDEDRDDDCDDDLEYNPSQSIPNPKTKKIQNNFSDTDKTKARAEILKLQTSPDTAQLSTEKNLAIVRVSLSTWYRWKNKCTICCEVVQVKRGSLVACCNWKLNFYISCLTKEFVWYLRLTQESQYYRLQDALHIIHTNSHI